MQAWTRRTFLRQAAGAGAFAAVAGAASPHACAAGRRPPNVVLMISDDQGWGDLSSHGNPNLRTPRLDALAAEGVRLVNFMVSSVCAPTRASLLTGRYHPRTGVRGTSRGEERLNLDEVTMADHFKRAGYVTGLFGKWHNGAAYPYHPNGRGFDEFHGFCCGHLGEYVDPVLEHNGRPVKARGFAPDVFTERALEFMRANRARPFLCWLAWNTPHSPFQVPERDFQRQAASAVAQRGALGDREDLPVTRAALALCENLDANVGRVLDTLRELDLERDTLVVFLSDNGPNSARWNGGMKGRKGSVDEGGLRVPCFVRWTGHVAPRAVTPVAAHIDLLPTLADLAGVPLKDGPPLDGVSLRPLLEGRAMPWPERMIFAAQGERVSVRTDRYRADAETLYDLEADPGQTRNIAAERPEEHRRLAAALAKWKAEVLPRGRDARPVPVGYRAFPVTRLQVQDATWVGQGLAYSSRHPNESWLTGWRDTAARVRWEIEVVEPGRFACTLYYACPASDTGAEVEVSAGAAVVRGRIALAHDPPVYNTPDRVPREETYNKEFRPLALGELRLEAGRRSVELRALSKPGRQVAEVLAVELRRLDE